MDIPADVAERADEMTDDEVIAACVAAGETEGYARIVLAAVRGTRDTAPDDLGIRLQPLV